MRSICLYFQIHQPFRLRKYNIFDMGVATNYYDEGHNKAVIDRVSQKCYLPSNYLMLELIKKFKGDFKVNYSISGTALEQLEKYQPEVIESFKALAQTGCVEFLAETYSHSLCSLEYPSEFKKEVKKHADKIKKLFGKKPQVFRNTELIYSDQIGLEVFKMGFKGMLTEGAKHVMGWRSPNFVYSNASEPKLKLLLRNYKLSDDIAFRFSNQSWMEYPLTADKYAGWLNEMDQKDEVVSLFMDYETLGEHQWEHTGIFEFMRHLPESIINTTDFRFGCASDIMDGHESVGTITIPHAISWADEERDLSAWMGNPLQNDALKSLYKWSGSMGKLKDEHLQRDWEYLQTSDHFYYMSTKLFSDGDVHGYFTHYDSPYDAYINYMNVISDFGRRVSLAEEKQEKQDKKERLEK